MRSELVWHGTLTEARELMEAVQHHCTCRWEGLALVTACPPHRMIVTSQRVIDGILFARRIRSTLQAEESCPAPSADAVGKEHPANR